MTAIICEYCSHETKYHSYNIDSFTGKKFDIYFCNKCLIAKTNLDKNFDLTHYYPKNYYGNEGKRFNVLFEYLVLFARYLRSFFCYRLFFKKERFNVPPPSSSIVLIPFLDNIERSFVRLT